MQHIYNEGAKKAIEKYLAAPLRTEDINLCLQKLDRADPDILEIGSSIGNGAKVMSGYKGTYLGIDYCEEFVCYARDRFPGLQFELADITKYKFSKDYDAIFAFAIMHFLSPDELEKVLGKLDKHLRSGGVILIDVKEGQGPKTKEDKWGSRSYWRYQLEDLQRFLGDRYEVIHENRQVIGGENWLTAAFKKNKNWI